MLQKHSSTKLRYFHQYCLRAAQKLVMSDPDICHLTNRYVDEKLN